MKSNFILLLLIPVLLFSQIQWQDNGVPVYCGENINWSGTVLNTDDGNMVILWSDSRNGDRGVFAQKITPDGAFLWGDNGIEINDDPDTQIKAEAITSLNGEIIIAWTSHYGNFDMEVRAQKIDAYGNRLWQSEGVLLCSSIEILPYSIKIIDDTSGGALIVWKNNVHYGVSTEPEIVRALHVFSDGSIDNNWNTGGNILTQNPRFWDVLPDGCGGFVYAWKSLYDLNIQRFDSNGNPLWGDEGIVLCEDTVCGNSFASVTDNNEFFYFFWQDSRNTNNNMIYMQKVDINGAALFQEDINIHSTDNSLSRIDAIYTSDDNLALCWAENNNSLYSLKTLKLDSFGNLLIIPIDIYNGIYSCYNANIIADNTGGYWLKWYNFVNYIELYVQHVDEFGIINLNNNGLFICEAIQEIARIAINLTSDNRAFLSWSDMTAENNSLYAQVVDEIGNLQFPENGLILHEGPSGSSFDLEIILNEDNPVFIWNNYRGNGRSKIFAQSLNSVGSPVFEENGIPITPLFSDDQENFDVHKPLDSNEIAIIWEMVEEGYKQVYAQAVDFDGNYLWSSGYGLQLGESNAEQKKPKISTVDDSDTSEYYIGWEDYADFMDGRIQGQKIIDGNLEWGLEGKTIVDRDGNDVLCDVFQNYYIWQSVGLNNRNIFCLMVNENGDPAPGWDSNGLEVCIEDGNQKNARTLEVADGLLIIWDDTRNGNEDVYGQIVTPDGTILWADGGIPLIDSANDQYFANMIYDDDYLYLVWQDYRSGENYEIYTQKFDENGNELWQAGGILIGEGQNPDIAKIDDKLVIVWENSNIDYFGDIYSQLLNLDGGILWDPDGIVLCDASWNQRNPQIVANENNDVYIGWLDDRIYNYDSYAGFYATSVFSQKIHIEPTFSPDDILNAITGKLHQNYPNPFNPSTTISFSLTPEITEDTELIIYNLKGQKVKTFPVILSGVEESGNNNYSVTWNGTDDNNKPVASGVYFYKLKAGNFEKSNKMLLLK